MGVTLERVQNKFACIIGELCSEPVILSQFAIWVDLRIAEYKAKGAISLDCSGSTPYPTWLKGLEPPKPAQSDASLQLNESLISSRNARHRVHRAPETVTGQHSHPDFSYSHSNIQTQAHVDRLINDFNGVIKQEPVETENVFPVGLHSHHNGALSHANSLQRSFSEHSETYSVRMHGHDRTQPLIQHSRKRISAEKDVFHSNNNIFPSSWPPKSRRLCSNSDNNFQVPTCVRTMNQDSNQSLLSVIGIDDTANTSSASKALPVEENSRGDNSIQTVQSSGSIHPDGTDWTRVDQGEDWQDADIELIEVLGPSYHATREIDERNVARDLSKVRGQIPQPVVQECSQSVQEPVPNAQEADPECQRVRWSTRMNLIKPRSTHKNTLCAVNSLRSFLYKHLERREIHTIPPEELDSYLVVFFSTIKRKNGSDYHPSSLISLRKFLDFNLKENGYPHSITTSPKFAKSQMSFRMKQMDLNSILSIRKASHEGVFHQNEAIRNNPDSSSEQVIVDDDVVMRNGSNAITVEQMQGVRFKDKEVRNEANSSSLEQVNSQGEEVSRNDNTCSFSSAEEFSVQRDEIHVTDSDASTAEQIGTHQDELCTNEGDHSLMQLTYQQQQQQPDSDQAPPHHDGSPGRWNVRSSAVYCD